MAKSVLELAVETGKWDAGLKKGTSSLNSFIEHAGGLQQALAKDSEKMQKFVQMMGNFESTAKTAKGQMNDYKSAIEQLTAQYNRMSDAQKQTIGQDYLSSIDKLKEKYKEAKVSADDLNKSLGNTKQAEDDAKSGLEGLTSALGINIKSLVGWGTALAAGKVALDVAKDAFFASEATVDEWGRTVQSAQSVYEGFLNAINNGDISGFLGRIDEIVRAARAAYDELDKLGTMKTIQAPKVSAQQTENERIRSMIQTGRYIAPIDGRRNAVFNGREMQNGDKLTAGQIRALEKQLQNGMQNVVKLVGNEVKQTGKAIDAYYNSMAKQNGMSLKEFKKGTSSWEEFSKKMQGYEQYKEWDKQARTEFAKQGGRGNVDFDKNNPFAEFRKWGVFRVDKEGENSYKDLVQLIQQRDQQAAQAYGMQSQAYRAINRAEGFTVSKLMGNGGSSKSGKQDIQFADDSIMAQEKLVQELTQKWKTASAAVKDDYKKQLDAAQSTLDTMMGKTAKAAAQPQMVTGLSGFNEQTISAWTSMIKSELAKADIGSDLYNSLTKNLRDMSFLTTTVQDAIKLGLEIPQDVVEQMYEQVFDQNNLPTDMYVGMIQKFIDDFKEKTGKDLQVGANGSLSEQKPEKQGKEEDDFKKFNDGIGKLTGGLSQVSSGLKAVGVEIPKEVDDVIGVISGVSQIISGVGSIISLFSTTAITANTAAVVANTAALGVNTATNFIPFFAGGGIVPHAANGYFVGGNSFSGDTTPIMANAGELVLNKAQQGNLAAQLEGSPVGGGETQPYLDGEKIFLGLQAYTRRSGLGEIVTSER